MPRHSRAIEPGIPYHVTQRGVNRQKVFFSDTDRRTYLTLIQQNIEQSGIRVHAWCLMGNHVHWVFTPERTDSLAVLLRRVHGRYAQYLNARLGRVGHLWQNRFYCCAVGPSHFWNALRYVELNPVRTGLVNGPAAFRWSSARVHLAGPSANCEPTLDWKCWREIGERQGWQELLQSQELTAEVGMIRQCTYSGKPYGSEAFVQSQEERFHRAWRNPGRPRKRPGFEKGSDLLASLCA